MITNRDIRFPSSTPGIELAGTATSPGAGESRALVLLLSGSGPQDRDQTVDGKATFRVLRQRLASAGFTAVSWDDRGCGGSGGDYLRSASDQLVEDVLSFLAWMDGPPRPTFLVGHSQGALIAALVAAGRPDLIRGVALLGAAGRPGREVLIAQHFRICAADGWGEHDTAALLRFKVACFDILAGFPEILTEQDQAELRTRLAEVVEEHFGREGEHGPLVEDLLEWEWRFLLRFDPAPLLASLSVPVFAATGERDLQSDPEEDLAAVTAALQSGACPSVTTLRLPELNHLFQRERPAGPTRYASLGRPFHPSLTTPLVSWISQRCAAPVR